MILGTGIDIVEVSRIEEAIRNSGFKEKVFSKSEIIYCESQVNIAQHYAARFAVKEAFLKATGEGMLISTDLYEIELKNNDKGKPEVILHNNLKDIAKTNNWNKIHVSVSHVKEMACAVVIIEE